MLYSRGGNPFYSQQLHKGRNDGQEESFLPPVHPVHYG